MHIKHIHETIECLSEYGKDMVKAGVGDGNVNIEDAGKVIDMIKDLSEAEYYSRINKAMEESEKEDEEEAKRIMREMKEQYGEEEGERRFYDNYRYANGRFAPKGRGTRRRGYAEPMYHMNSEMYREHDPEWYRDMDRADGRMYYSGGNTGGNMGGSRSGGNMGGGSSSRGYSDGYSDGMSEGTRRGYEDGRRDGERMGRNSQSQSRYDRAKRGYEEHKMNRDDSPEGKKKSMENLEEYMRELGSDMSEMIGKMDSSEKAMVKSKLQTLMQKIQ